MKASGANGERALNGSILSAGYAAGAPRRAAARRRLQLSVAVAVLATVVAIAVWLTRVPSSLEYGAVVEALALASPPGEPVIPGALPKLSNDMPAVRGSGVPLTPALEAELATLNDRYRDGSISSVELELLIATNLAIGQLSTARRMADDALLDGPDSPELLHLRGLIAWRMGEMEEAEAYLRRSVGLVPHDTTNRFNLACLLSATGRTEESIRELEVLSEGRLPEELRARFEK